MKYRNEVRSTIYVRPLHNPKRGKCDLCSTYTWTHNTEFEGEELYLCNKCKEDLFYHESR